MTPSYRSGTRSRTAQAQLRVAALGWTVWRYRAVRRAASASGTVRASTCSDRRAGSVPLVGSHRASPGGAAPASTALLQERGQRLSMMYRRRTAPELCPRDLRQQHTPRRPPGAADGTADLLLLLSPEGTAAHPVLTALRLARGRCRRPAPAAPSTDRPPGSRTARRRPAG